MNRVDDFIVTDDQVLIRPPSYASLSHLSQSSSALRSITERLDTSAAGAHLAKRKLEYRRGDESVVVDEEFYDSRARHPQVVYVAEHENLGKLAIFCIGFAASAVIVALTLLFAWILQS